MCVHVCSGVCTCVYVCSDVYAHRVCNGRSAGSRGPSLLAVLTLPASACGDLGQVGLGPPPGLRGPGALLPTSAPPWLSAAWRQGPVGVKEKLATPGLGPRRSCLWARPWTRWSVTSRPSLATRQFPDPAAGCHCGRSPGGAVILRGGLSDSSQQLPGTRTRPGPRRPGGSSRPVTV